VVIVNNRAPLEKEDTLEKRVTGRDEGPVDKAKEDAVGTS
jgi:hypothetical protein